MSKLKSKNVTIVKTETVEVFFKNIKATICAVGKGHAFTKSITIIFEEST